MNTTPSFDSRANEARDLDPTTAPDQLDGGATVDGGTWSVARYGTLVVNTELDAAGNEVASDDIECADQADARREWVCARDAWRDEEPSDDDAEGWADQARADQARG